MSTKEQILTALFPFATLGGLQIRTPNIVNNGGKAKWSNNKINSEKRRYLRDWIMVIGLPTSLTLAIEVMRIVIYWMIRRRL